MGSFMLVWFEGDVEKAFNDLATRLRVHDWFRARVLDVTGVDLAPRRTARLRRSSSTIAPDVRHGANHRPRLARTDDRHRSG